MKISKAFLWTTFYFGIMLFYTFLDVAIWRKIFYGLSNWVNMMTILLCIGGFIVLLRKTGFRVKLSANMTLLGFLSALACSVLLYLILDHFLDPLFESIFPLSEQAYQETIQALTSSPITSFLQVCFIAPVIEEILMRGFILGGLKKTYNAWVALFVSAALFALLHFNMVQTLSAFICAVFLGILYLKTNSILCCIIAHGFYNLISFMVMIYPFIII